MKIIRPALKLYLNPIMTNIQFISNFSLKKYLFLNIYVNVYHIVLFPIDKRIYNKSQFDIFISDSKKVIFIQSDKEIELGKGVYLYSYEESEVLLIPLFYKYV